MKTLADEKPTAPRPLAGRRIVVTRPLAQSDTLAAAIRALGGEPLIFPLLTIESLADTAPIAALAERLDQFALAVFVSPNAVTHALAHLRSRPWPAGLRVAALGKSSERALAAQGFKQVIAPQERYDSEALLELAPLQAAVLRGHRVIIFRGNGGRELLGDTLKARGAEVEYLCCYRRGQPAASDATRALWSEGRIDAVTLSSSEGLRNLWDMLDSAGRRRLARLPLLVPHARIAEEAVRLGLNGVVLTGPGDAGLSDGLAQLRFEEDKCPH